MIKFAVLGRFTSFCVSAALLLAATSSVHAQSLKVSSPAPMSAGVNRATIDSFGGAHYWYFTAQPGHFHMVFSGGNPQEGFTIGGKAAAGAAFGPKTPGSVLTWKDIASGTVFDGSVTQPSRVVVMVEPRNSPLVRQTTDYILEATGSVSFGAGTGSSSSSSSSSNDGGAASGASATAHGGTSAVVGVYNVKIGSGGAAKFLPDGSIVTTTGEHGSWELFDEGTRTYVVVLAGQRYTLTFQPARGFIDNNNNLTFEAKVGR